MAVPYEDVPTLIRTKAEYYDRQADYYHGLQSMSATLERALAEERLAAFSAGVAADLRDMANQIERTEASRAAS